MLKEEDLVSYIPEVDGNRDADPCDQWHIDFFPMTAAEQRRYLLSASDAKSDAAKAKKAAATLKQIFSDRVREVHNLVDIKGKPITSGQEFYDNSETDYIDEVWEAMTKASTLRRGMIKN